MDETTRKAIERYIQQMQIVEDIKSYIWNDAEPYIDPILKSGDPEQLKELLELAIPGYVQFEARMLLRYARKDKVAEENSE